jgi:hypothetical protein
MGTFQSARTWHIAHLLHLTLEQVAGSSNLFEGHFIAILLLNQECRRTD